jgi:VCBS repeat protein/FG-GAP repeat protein
MLLSALILAAVSGTGVNPCLAAEPLGHHPIAMVQGDLNADGNVDLVVANYNDDYISVLLGDGHGSFGPQRRYFVWNQVSSLQLGDFNQDGKLDLVVNLAPWMSWILLGRGDGSFNPFSGTVGGWSIAALDFNGDGLLDIAATSQFSAGPASEGSVGLAFGKGDGTFEGGVGLSLVGMPRSLTVGDFDRDGAQDLAVGYMYSCYPGRPDLGCNGIIGGFGVLSLKKGWRQYDLGQTSDALAAGDFNRDGEEDLLLGGPMFNLRFQQFGTSLFTGDSDPWDENAGAGFSSLGQVAEGYTHAYAVADFNDDGIPDFATPFVTYLNQGDGTFNSAQYLPTTAASTSAVVSGDFDFDGKTDLAIADGWKDTLTVWLGKGDGNFTKVLTSHQSPHAPIAVASAQSEAECGATVHLDGRDSSDVDSTAGTNDDILLFEWFENYDTPRGSRLEPLAWRILGTGPVLETTLPLGTHGITLRVMDSGGKTSLSNVTIRVADAMPPAISLSLSPNLLWPPNHRLVDITANLVASDACGPAHVSLESITSSEPADQSILGASFGQPDFSFQLRAERGTGQGRIYTVTYLATDGSGNASRASAVVQVPLSQSAQ